MPTSTFAAGDTGYIAKLNELANASFTASNQGSNFSAAKGYWYLLTTTALTVTLPASPTVGDRIRFASASSSITSVTFARNGSNIDGAASDKTLSGSESAPNVEIVYVDASIGWRIVQYGLAGAIAFSVKTGAFSAAKDNVYAIDASTFTVTLPASPAAGDTIRLFATNASRSAITLGRNGLNINSAAADYVINTYNWDLVLVYVNATVGWRTIFNFLEVRKAPSISAGTLTLDCENGLAQTFDVALNANITTLTISNIPPTGNPFSFELVFTADGTARTVTWGAAVKWPGNVAPTLTSTNTKKDRFLLETLDGGTSWLASIIGQNH